MVVGGVVCAVGGRVGDGGRGGEVGGGGGGGGRRAGFVGGRAGL